jgi:hypothetical protein
MSGLLLFYFRLDHGTPGPLALARPRKQEGETFPSFN